jgi:hypothetical protein
MRARVAKAIVLVAAAWSCEPERFVHEWLRHLDDEREAFGSLRLATACSLLVHAHRVRRAVLRRGAAGARLPIRRVLLVAVPLQLFVAFVAGLVFGPDCRNLLALLVLGVASYQMAERLIVVVRKRRRPTI